MKAIAQGVSSRGVKAQPRGKPIGQVGLTAMRTGSPLLGEYRDPGPKGIQKMNAAVDLDKQDPGSVAKQFLAANGLA